MMTIDPSKIRKSREKKGFSQEALAQRLHITQSSYAKIEAGKRKIEADLLFRIAEELEESIENFMKENDTSFQQTNYKNENAYIQNFHHSKVDLYEMQIKLLRDEIESMRKEREKFLEIIQSKLMG